MLRSTGVFRKLYKDQYGKFKHSFTAMISPSHFAQYTEASTSHAAQIPTPASIQPLAPSLVTTIPLTSSQAGTPASGQTAALPVQANTKPSKKSLASATAKAHTESLQQATVDDSGKSKGQR